MPFGQIVIGPPAAGKTVYCSGMAQFMEQVGRKTAIVNLDPANDFLPYIPAIDINDLIRIDKIMDDNMLGPNGGLIYAIEFLEKNIEWLKKRLEVLTGTNHISPLVSQSEFYIIFDCPGQVELYTHHSSMKNITNKLQSWGYRITCIHLIDSFVCTQPSTYISACLLSLSTMLQLELPHINVLSKVDLLPNYGKLDFNLEFYTSVLDLHYLQEILDQDPFGKRFKKLNEVLCDLIEDFDLVSFQTLDIQDKVSVNNLLKAIDKSNGYVYGAFTYGNESILQVAEHNTSSTSHDVEENFTETEEFIIGEVEEKM